MSQKNHHFLNVHQDEACLTVCYVLFSHSRVVYPQSWELKAWSDTLRKPPNPNCIKNKTINYRPNRPKAGYGPVMMMMMILTFDPFPRRWTAGRNRLACKGDPRSSEIFNNSMYANGMGYGLLSEKWEWTGWVTRWIPLRLLWLLEHLRCQQ